MKHWKVKPRRIELSKLKSRNLLEMAKMLDAVSFEELMDDKQKRIVNILKKREFVSEKELLEELKMTKPTLIKKITKLENAGIIFSNRSSTKILTLNPSIFYFNEVIEITKKHILLIAHKSGKMKREGIGLDRLEGKKGIW